MPFRNICSICARIFFFAKSSIYLNTFLNEYLSVFGHRAVDIGIAKRAFARGTISKSGRLNSVMIIYKKKTC